MSNSRTIHRSTGFLLPPSVDEWLPQRHFAHFVEVIEGLDLSALVKSYRTASGSASSAASMVRPGAASTTALNGWRRAPFRK